MEKQNKIKLNKQCEKGGKSYHKFDLQIFKKYLGHFKVLNHYSKHLYPINSIQA